MGVDTLESSEELYRSLIEASEDFVFALDLEGKFMFANTNAIETFGDLIGKPFTIPIPSEYQGLVKGNFEKRQKGEEIKPYQIEVLDKNEDRVLVEVSGSPLIKEGKTLGLVYFLRDITERKKAEEALKASEEKYRNLFDNNIIGVGITDGSGNCLAVNDAMCRLTGFSREEWFKTNIAITYANLEDRERLFETLKDEGKVENFEVQLYNKKREKYWCNLSVKPIKYEGKEALLATASDITENRTAVEAQRISESRLKDFLDSATEAFSLWDSELNLVMCNDLAKKIFKTGTMKDDLIGKDIVELVPDVKESGRYDQYMSVIKTREPLQIVDIIPHPKFGDIRFSLKAFKVANGIGMIVSDITEQKRVEEALQESMKKYRSVVETAGSIILVLSKDHSIVEWNQEAERLYGWKREDVLGKNYLEMFIPEEFRDRIASDIKKVIAGESTRGFENPIVSRDGTEYLILWNVTRLLNVKNQPIGIIAIGQDISERKKAEEALKMSEEKYKNLVESSLAGVYILNLDLEYLYLNSKLAEMGGYKIEELMGRSVLDFLTEESAKRTKEFMRQWIEKEIEAAHFEIDSVRKDGEIITLEVFGRGTIYNDEPAVQGTVLDITEKKRSDEEMMKKFMKYKIEKGNSYLIKEAKLDLSKDVFLDLTSYGFSGTILSRRRREEVEEVFGKDANIYWIAEKKGDKILTPNFKDIESVIENLHPRDNVVLLDRLDYLVVKNGFKKTLGFIQKLNELFYLKKWVLILTLDPKTLNVRELSLLENESNMVKPKREMPLDEDIDEILKYVYEMEKGGRKVSYKDVRQKFGITKQTTRKRIGKLKDGGYVIDKKKGRFKILELTEKGKDYF